MEITGEDFCIEFMTNIQVILTPAGDVSSFTHQRRIRVTSPHFRGDRWITREYQSEYAILRNWLIIRRF